MAHQFNQEEQRGGETMGGTTRLIRVDIKIRNATKINISKQNKAKTSWKTLSLVSSYHPTTRQMKSRNMQQISWIC